MCALLCPLLRPEAGDEFLNDIFVSPSVVQLRVRLSSIPKKDLKHHKIGGLPLLQGEYDMKEQGIWRLVALEVNPDDVDLEEGWIRHVSSSPSVLCVETEVSMLT
jgi:hypothetical protein